MWTFNIAIVTAVTSLPLVIVTSLPFSGKKIAFHDRTLALNYFQPKKVWFSHHLVFVNKIKLKLIFHSDFSLVLISERVFHP